MESGNSWSREECESWSLPAHWLRRGITRRGFLQFCGAMAAVLGLPPSFTGRIAHALVSSQRPVLVWLHFQDCTGDSESLLRADDPSITDILLDILSVDYHETLMVPCGHQAEKSLQDAIRANQGKYLAVVEGAIPTKDNGVYCMVAGRTALEIAREVCGQALATIAVGTCAAFGGLPAAAPNPTGAVGVQEAVPGIKVVNLPGCPMNGVNLAATVVHFLTFGALPATDQFHRPLFVHGDRVHEKCERRSHFEAQEFVMQWGDEGHWRGWCLYLMGCKGPETWVNCPTIRWNGGTNWPVRAGHGCVGCSQPQFWDRMTPFYTKLARLKRTGDILPSEFPRRQN
jgi:hydrogenase small subunit